jgi:hypothetical protein
MPGISTGGWGLSVSRSGESYVSVVNLGGRVSRYALVDSVDTTGAAGLPRPPSTGLPRSALRHWPHVEDSTGEDPGDSDSRQSSLDAFRAGRILRT